MAEPNEDPASALVSSAEADMKARDGGGSDLGASATESPNQSVERTSTNAALGTSMALLNLNEIQRSVDDKGFKSARHHKESQNLLPASSSTSARRSSGPPVSLELFHQIRRASLDIGALNDVREDDADPTSSQNLLEDEMFPVNDTLVPEIEAYLREKIQCNRSDTQAKDIREFVLSRLSSAEIRQLLPPLLARLQSELGSAALDIQSSLCVVEDLFSDVGRASPLVGMYTDEEEDMLKSLELRTVL
ncbi:hypothetical protein H310_14483 [Aphanomyces invadans]|uniref:Uncharacterized protein n=1 Tax=Aphanomyces invadans TaxID=157072 RepID=A0A024T9K6_9STRA|nr:hypothetical protein H310_14483 [Aphanomyces invadans]ETV90820.1 hypothetical protein H310_14483 [Aphanomyces invadans]|eukprot:XP_008880577.1 hypothetical protein H310_14483 [Aphanomyces invadans]